MTVACLLPGLPQWSYGRGSQTGVPGNRVTGRLHDVEGNAMRPEPQDWLCLRSLLVFGLAMCVPPAFVLPTRK